MSIESKSRMSENKEKEIWKKILIENLSDKYEISNLGNVRNSNT